MIKNAIKKKETRKFYNRKILRDIEMLGVSVDKAKVYNCSINRNYLIIYTTDG